MVIPFLSTRRRQEPTRRTPSRRLGELESRLAVSSPMSRPGLYKQLGDLHLAENRADAALSMYRLAVDEYLTSGLLDAATAVCRKAAHVVPDAQRSHCARWLVSIAVGSMEEAAAELQAYVTAAELSGGVADVVKTMKRALAVARDHEVRLQIGYQLLLLGQEDSADEIFAEVYLEQNGLSKTVDEHQDKRKETFVRLAIGGMAGAENAFEAVANRLPTFDDGPAEEELGGLDDHYFRDAEPLPQVAEEVSPDPAWGS